MLQKASLFCTATLTPIPTPNATPKQNVNVDPKRPPPTRMTLGTTQLTVHPVCDSPNTSRASRLVQAMSALLMKTRRAPSRHSRDARVLRSYDYGHAQTEHTHPHAHASICPPSLPLSITPFLCSQPKLTVVADTFPTYKICGMSMPKPPSPTRMLLFSLIPSHDYATPRRTLATDGFQICGITCRNPPPPMCTLPLAIRNRYNNTITTSVADVTSSITSTRLQENVTRSHRIR